MIRTFVRRTLKVLLSIVLVIAVSAAIAVGSIEGFCRPDVQTAQTAAPPATDEPAYRRRDAANTYFTFPEWYIVYSFEDFGLFLDKKSESAFPYFSQIAGFWRSFCAVNGIAAALPGDHFQVKMMIYVIGISYSAEFAVKGIYEKTIGRLFEWIRGPEPVAEDIYARSVVQDYGAFLHTIPWYLYPFGEKLSGLWNDMPLVGESPARSIERKFALSLEYLFKVGYAKLIALGLAATSAPEDRDIMFVVDADPGPILAAEPSVSLVAELPDGGAILLAPRYSAFTDLLQRLAAKGVDVEEIAGNRRILMTAIVPDGAAPEVEGSAELFAMPLDARPGYRRVGFDLEVPRLSQILRAYQSAGVEVEHLYDY